MNSLAYTIFGGFAMALADSVPGVSGGTIAFLLGFYDRFVGALAITAMVLPGISGSSLLMSFGLYLPVIAALKDALALHFQRLWMLVPLALGIAAGLAVFPHMLKRLMENHAGAVTYAVLGMMVGSIYAIIVGPTTLKVPQHAMTFADFDALWFALGAALMLVLSFLKSRLARRQENGTESRPLGAGVDKKGLLR